MNKIKSTILIGIVMLITLFALCGNVDAASSIRASSSSVTVGKNVSVTVSFGQRESAAQFKLNYDKSKFDYVSCSAGTYASVTNTFVYVNYEDVADLGSVTFTFKATATGKGTFSISGVVLSSDNSSISSGSTTVTVNQATSTNTNKKPTTNNSSNKNQNKTEEQPVEPEIIDKKELNNVKDLLEGKVETDYTPESWKAVQDAIASAEATTTNKDYDAIKEKLTLDGLVKASFEKEELNKVLRDLIGKVQNDYTEESWNELKEAIDIADNAELKSEYDAIKDKLTINKLILEERNFFLSLIQNPCGHGIVIISLAAAILVLLIIIIVMLIVHGKQKKKVVPTTGGRRLK